jgi:crotonobetainyl-CoA:carnitine CoA-transferase CaiB-like acyl-CoA transferase
MKGLPSFTSFDPVLRESGLTVEFEHPLYGSMVRCAPALRFSETPSRLASPCLRGAHNRSVLRELGYSDDDITRLEEDGVVAPPDAKVS